MLAASILDRIAHGIRRTAHKVAPLTLDDVKFSGEGFQRFAMHSEYCEQSEHGFGQRVTRVGNP